MHGLRRVRLFVLPGPLLKPWDFAAGLLLVREAGGHAASFAGAHWSGLGPATSILCTGAPPLWEELRNVAKQGTDLA